MLERARHVHEAVAQRPRLDAGHRLVAELFGAVDTPLTPGAVGDLVVRDETGVRHVVVGGQVVVRDRMLVHGDLDAIGAEAEREARGLWARMAEL